MTREIPAAALARIQTLPADIRKAADASAKLYQLEDGKLLLTGGQFNGDRPRTLARRHAIAMVAKIKVGSDVAGEAWKYTTDEIAGFFQITRVAVLEARRSTKLFEHRGAKAAQPEA